MTSPEQAERVDREEVLAREPVEALAGLLDIDRPDDDLLPPLWHWLYLLERRPSSDLGPDGHPTSGIPAPPGPGMRRMFAGGRVETLKQLRVAEPASRTTSIAKTAEKTGRNGPLKFVTVRHEFWQDGSIAIVEEQDIVYRAADAAAPPTAADGPIPSGREAQLELAVDERLLFRFSALTYNAHRIHYDRDWCRFEGYDDLVIHGPLQALMMGELARRNGQSLIGRRFAYRLVSPMIGPQVMHLVAAADGLARGVESYAANGRRTAVATLDG